MLKDRVTIKERINIETGKNVKPGSSSLTPDYMNNIIDEMLNSKKEAVINLTSTPPEAVDIITPPIKQVTGLPEDIKNNQEDEWDLDDDDEFADEE